MGQTYVTIEANEVMPLADEGPSGGDSGTGGEISYWIYWTTYSQTPGQTGFTGQGWFIGDPNTPWAALGYTDNKQVDELAEKEGNLDDYLGESVWPKKGDFVWNHDDLKDFGCIVRL